MEKATTGAIYIFPIPGAFDRGFEVKFFYRWYYSRWSIHEGEDAYHQRVFESNNDHDTYIESRLIADIKI